jgi:KDO2-lipid IV(A) lauroyltransferase
MALSLIDGLSLPAAGKVVTRLADLAYFFSFSRRKTAKTNILRSGIVTDHREAAAMARESFRHFALLVLESLKSDRLLNADNWRDMVDIDVHPETLALFEKPGQGVILVSGHLGNWEIAAQLLSHLKPVVGVTRDMNNPYADRLIKQRKPRNRFSLTPKHHADSARFLSVLKEGNILALLIDQHASRKGMLIDFFGIPASTHTSPALLHLVTRTPICFGYCIRTGPMSYRLKASAPIVHESTGRREDDVKSILKELTGRLEQAIRENPLQYLWAHRRWRKQQLTDRG